MKKSLLIVALCSGGILSLLSFQKAESSAKNKKIGSYIKLQCSKTYPSGTYIGIKCAAGGIQFCTENNPNCLEMPDS